MNYIDVVNFIPFYCFIFYMSFVGIYIFLVQLNTLSVLFLSDQIPCSSCLELWIYFNSLVIFECILLVSSLKTEKCQVIAIIIDINYILIDVIFIILIIIVKVNFEIIFWNIQLIKFLTTPMFLQHEAP